MWQQGTTHGFRLDDTEPAETEENGHYLSFAKRSREVHRHPGGTVCFPARDLLHCFSSSSHGEELWEKILRHPSKKASYYDECCRDPLNLFSREPTEKVWAGVSGTREDDLSVNTLPSPAQLLGRRKKGGGRVQSGDTAQRQAAAVTQHIWDLRKKQCAVERMKKEKWWGLTLGYTPENGVSFDVANLTSPETLWSLDPSHTRRLYTAPSPTHLGAVTVTPQVFGCCEEEVVDLAPGGNPMMSFVVTGIAHREIDKSWNTPDINTSGVAAPCLDTPFQNTEFWGFPSIIED